MINSKPLGDNSVNAYEVMASESPMKNVKISFDTASEFDEIEDDEPKSPPILIN